MSRIALLSTLICLALATWAAACDRCGTGVRCEVCGFDTCPCQMVQKTIMVPMCVTETRMKTKTVETMKEREETYTVFKRVPEKRTYSKECCYLQDEIKSKEITKVECVRVQNPLTLEDKVKVPVTEIHEGVRRREICTLCGKVCIEEPCTCTITRTADAPRVQQGQREDVVFPERKCTIDYQVTLPKFQKVDCGVETVYKLVPETKTRKVQVCVPETIQVPCDVKVTRMVAQQVCCCEHCWCEIERQKEQEKLLAKHAEHLHKATAVLPKPSDCGEKCLEHGKKVVGAPKAILECFGTHVKALNPLK